MQKRNIWIATGSLSVMALGLGVAVADSNHAPRDLGSSINRSSDDGAATKDRANGSTSPGDDVGNATTVDSDRLTLSPAPSPTPKAVESSAPSAASAPSVSTPAAPAPVLVPAPAPVQPPVVSGNSGYSAPSAVSASSGE